MYKTQAKIDNMSTADWHQYRQLLSNARLVQYFSDEVLRFSHTSLKPDDVLRRFSLNGDGQLDVREFQLTLKRLGILQFPASNDTPQQQQETANALTKGKELYSVFCPAHTRKLGCSTLKLLCDVNIDMFCRIMTEWSLQLIRARHQQQQTRPGSSRGSSCSNHRPPSYRNYDASQSVAAPYATETPRSASGGAILSSLHGNASGSNSESDAIWRRITDAIAHNVDKLSQIFFKMDITCSGSVNQEEFELGMNHIGVFLTPREYEKVYESLSLELKDFSAKSNGNETANATSRPSFGVKYADFLALFHNKSPLVLPTTSTQAFPPVAGVGNARLWDFLVASIDKLQPLFQQLERINQRYVTPDTFRDCLLRCGLALSNADYAALRSRLTCSYGIVFQGFVFGCNWTGAAHAGAQGIGSQLNENLGRVVPDRDAVGASECRRVADSHGATNQFPIGAREQLSAWRSDQFAQPASYPAGKSNEQRNVEANRTIVKIRDESRWKSDITLNPHRDPAKTAGAEGEGGDQNTATTCEDPMFGGRPHAPLEKRTLLKLQQMKELRQLGTSSPQTIFPGDRFGRITRGQFRQSLVHLSVLARYIANHDLYDHFNSFLTRSRSNSSADAGAAWLPAINTESGDSTSPTHGQKIPADRLPRSAQKVLEGMLIELPHLLSICQRNGVDQTGMISPQELLTAIQELGILASTSDLQSAIFTIFSGLDNSSSSNGGGPPTMPCARLETRLGQLCSDLLSPKKRKKHLLTTSVLLAPQEQSYDEVIGDKHEYDMHTVSETEALWNCPRRKMNQGHRATKTSVRISDHISDDVGLVATNLSQSVPKSMQQKSYHSGSSTLENGSERKTRMNRLAVIAILHDLLERRIDLKTAMDLHRNADVHGQVSKDDLAEILLTSRLSLNFSSSSSGISVRDFVEALYPSSSTAQPLGITYLDLLHRASNLLAELKQMTTSTGSRGAQATGTQQQRQAARRLNSNFDIGLPSTHNTTASTSSGLPTMNSVSSSSFSSDETSVRKKLLQESRLKEVLLSDSGRQSAAILIRHAFKGLAPREMVVPIENGEYEAMCRSNDIKHVCYRLGLDLDMSEQQFVILSIDKNGVGFVSSPQLLEFFTSLAQSAADQSPSYQPPSSSLPRVTKGGHYPGFFDKPSAFEKSSLGERQENSYTGDSALFAVAMAASSSCSGLPRLIYPSPSSKQLMSAKDASKMNRVTSGIGGVLDNLQTKIDMLDREIKADEKGKQDYDDQLFRLRKRREDLEVKLRESQNWIALFESKIAPLEGKYAETTESMQSQYEDAKLRHAQGIRVLMENFDYHPEFKRFSDTFSAVPFKPK
ncbi:hypothetical protein FI667_g6635, partial [Globisporangium splendens]